MDFLTSQFNNFSVDQEENVAYVHDDNEVHRMHTAHNTVSMERPQRVEIIHRKLKHDGLLSEQGPLVPVQPTEATDEQIARVHSDLEFLIDRLRNGVPPGPNGVYVDTDKVERDCYWVPETSEAAARISAGCVITAGNLVFCSSSDQATPYRSAFANCRPPGHHACNRVLSGFCLLNNVAIAVKDVQARVTEKTGAKPKVAIVDFDVHYGDGTQAVFDDDPSVLYISLHRYSKKFFPYTGAATVVGSGAGAGTTVNVAFTDTTAGDLEYAAAFHSVVGPILQHFQADCTFVSAGFDAGAGDPLGGFAVTPAGFAWMTQFVQQRVSGGKLCVALEGGYNLHTVRDSACAVVRRLLRAPLTAEEQSAFQRLDNVMDMSLPVRKQCLKDLNVVLKTQRPFWPPLNAVPNFTVIM